MASLKKIVGLAVLGIFPPFIFFGGPILLPILYLEWRYVRFCIKMDLIVIYLLIRIPIWLLIQLPLYSIGVATHRIENFFVSGLRKIREAPVLSIFLSVVAFAVFFFLIAPQLAIGEPEFFNIYWWYSSLFDLFKVFFFTVFSVITLLSLKEALSGNVARKEMPAEWSRDQMKGIFSEAEAQSVGVAKRNYERYQRAQEMKEQAGEVKKAFNDIKMPSSPGKPNLLSGDLRAMFDELLEMFGM